MAPARPDPAAAAPVALALRVASALRVACVAALGLVGSAPAAERPDAAALAARWAEVSPLVSEHSQIPVNLEARDFERIAAGDVARSLVPGEVMLASQGAQWIPESCVHFWVALQDPEHLPVGKQDTVLQRLPGSTAARRLNYQHVKTPWPLADRQQTFAVTANKALWEASGGQVWERAVSMLGPELAPSPDPDAVWIPYTGGGFVLVEALGGCLTILQLEVDPGGSVPADLATRLGLGMMKRNMEQIAAYARGTSAHYTAGHPPVLRPDGTVVPAGGL